MADADWAAFGGPPTAEAQPPGAAAPAGSSTTPAVSAAPAGDGWAAFGGPPGSDAPAAAPAAQPAAASQGSAHTGILPNMAAGIVEGGAGVLNVAADPFGNLIGKPLATLMVTGHDLLAPMLGYHKFTPEERDALFSDDVPQPGRRIADAIGRAVDAPPVSSVQPGNALEGALRAGAAGAVGMGALGAGSRPSALARLAMGGAGGVTGNVAGQLVSDQYRPLAELLGNVAGAAVPGGAMAIASGGKSMLADYLASTLGRSKPVLDNGTPVVASDGTPITATSRQAELAGQQLQGAATNPSAARQSLADLVAPAIPGDLPTTAQVTRDPGLGQLERGVARGSPDAAAAFKARADAQNDARVGTVRQIADGADPAAVPSALQQLAGQTDSALGAQVQRTQQQADTARGAMGGDLPAGSESTLGQMLRQPLQESLAATRQRESQLWHAIDPDGKLAVDMRPIRDQANQIAGQISPNAAPLSGDEAGIMQTARGLPDVQSFQDLAALRSRLTDSIRAARSDPTQAQAVRRMSMLLDSVHDAMEGGVNGQAAQDAAAVQAGRMAPDQTMMSKLQAEASNWRVRRDQQAAIASGGSSLSSSGINAGSRSSAFSGPPRAEGQAGGRLGPDAGNQGVSSQADPLTPNFDPAAQQRYATARQATADRVATYRNAPGVGTVLQQGQTAGSFKTPDAAVPQIIVKVGPQGADVVRAYRAAGGNDAALTDAAAYSLRQAAERPDGTLDPAKYQQWVNQRSSFLSELPDAANRFRTAAQAQSAVDDAMATRAQVSRAIQGSVLGKFLGDADPVTRVAQVLRGPTGAADMRTLAQAVRSNPDAKAGLQRAVAEYILRDLKGNAQGVTSGETYLRGEQFQNLVARSEPALREVLSPEQMQNLRNVADSLARSNLSVGGTKLAGGSDTAQNLGVQRPALFNRIGQGIAESLLGGGTGAGVGSLVGGHVGAMVGSTVGAALGKAVQAARQAGIENVDHLVTEAMLNPRLAHLLMTKVTPQSEASTVAALTAELRRMSLVAGAGIDTGQEKRHRPVSRLGHLAALAPTGAPSGSPYVGRLAGLAR